jgi:hypothetical protein
MNNIDFYKNIYDINATSFVYSDAEPIYNYQLKSFDKLFSNKLQLKIFAALDYKLVIHKKFFAYNQKDNYSFYVSDKELENRDDCRRQNFDVAMNVLNNKIINP